MASTYSSRLRFEQQATGENSDTWGTNLNNNVIQLVDDAIAAYTTIDLSSVAVTLTRNNGSTDQSRAAFLELKGTLTQNVDIVVPSISKGYVVRNNTTGSFNATLKCLGGSGVAVPQTGSLLVVCDGVSVRAGIDAVGLGVTGIAQLSATQTFTGANTFTSASTFSGLVTFTSALTVQTSVSILGNVTLNGSLNANIVQAAGVSVVTSAIETGFSKLQYQQLVTISPASSITWDWSTAPIALLSLAQDTSISAVNMQPGATGLLLIAQVTGSHSVVSWPAAFVWSNSAVPALTTTASAVDVVSGIAMKSNLVLVTETPFFKIP